MSEEKLEVLRKAIDALNRDDIDAFAELFAPDATWHPLPDWPDSRSCQGREEIARLVRSGREPLTKHMASAEKVVESGDSLVVAGRWAGLIRGTDDEVELRLGMTLTFRGGKVTEWRMFRTFDDALEAAGLRDK